MNRILTELQHIRGEHAANMLLILDNSVKVCTRFPAFERNPYALKPTSLYIFQNNLRRVVTACGENSAAGMRGRAGEIEIFYRRAILRQFRQRSEQKHLVEIHLDVRIVIDLL